MIDKQVIEGLKVKFAHIHPLIFHRSLERASSGGDLFDILDTMPIDYPIIWNDREHRWDYTEDIFLIKEFVKNKED